MSEVVVVPVLTGALGVTSKTLKDWLKKLDVKSNIELLQKAALLGTAKKRDKHSNNNNNNNNHNKNNNTNLDSNKLINKKMIIITMIKINM